MGLKDKMKVNTVSMDFRNYYYYIKGVPKSGKTTMFRDLILELYKNPEAGLLISLGDEQGYKALDNIQAVDCEDWAEFEEIVDDLIENILEANEVKLKTEEQEEEFVFEEEENEEEEDDIFGDDDWAF